MIYIIEGPDGVGKTTLARAIQDKTKAHLLHCTYYPAMHVENYHYEIMNIARKLNVYQDVIIDRWAVSEIVYANVFRGGASYDTDKAIDMMSKLDVKWIYCKNKDAVKNHLVNRIVRKEMFDNMEDVVVAYEDYIKSSKLSWVTYDFNEVHMDKFVDKITNKQEIL